MQEKLENVYFWIYDPFSGFFNIPRFASGVFPDNEIWNTIKAKNIFIYLHN